MRGARAGAACKALDPAFTEHADPEIRTAYNEGWKAGRWQTGKPNDLEGWSDIILGGKR